MSTPSDHHEYPSTYFVQDRTNEQEVARLTVQGRLMTNSMGGALPEQPDPSTLRHVLDIACGIGGWILEAARTYPGLTLTGIDISKPMIDYARQQAEAQQLDKRTEFRVMDALLVNEAISIRLREQPIPVSLYRLRQRRCTFHRETRP